MRSIPNLPTNGNIERPVITYRHVPINWQDGTVSYVPIVSEPRQADSLEDRPIVINGITAHPEAFSQAVA